MTDDPLFILSAFAAGIATGALYLAALWHVVRRLGTAKRPGLLIAGSAVLRLGPLLAVWYWISGGRWQGLAACVLGFVIVRLGVTCFMRATAIRLTDS